MTAYICKQCCDKGRIEIITFNPGKPVPVGSTIPQINLIGEKKEVFCDCDLGRYLSRRARQK